MKRTKKISEGVRVAQVRQLFVARHPDPAKRTATTVLIFYGWLERHRRPVSILEVRPQRPIPSLTPPKRGWVSTSRR